MFELRKFSFFFNNTSDKEKDFLDSYFLYLGRSIKERGAATEGNRKQKYVTRLVLEVME